VVKDKTKDAIPVIIIFTLFLITVYPHSQTI